MRSTRIKRRNRRHAAKSGYVVLLTLMGLSGFVLLANSTSMMTLHHGILTQHFTAQAQAFWMAEYGASEAVGWLLRYPSATIPPSVITLPGGDAQLGFPAPEAQVAGQGRFEATITPGAMFYTIDSTGFSPDDGVRRRIIRAVRVVPPTTRQVDINLQLGQIGQVPAAGDGSGFSYRGWQQWDQSPHHVVWNPWGASANNWNPGNPSTAGWGETRVLFVKLDEPLAPGRYSVDIEAAYTACTPLTGQCPGGVHEERMMVYVGGAGQDVRDPENLTTEEFHWYPNVGSCTDVANCGEGNFYIPTSSSPLYFHCEIAEDPVQGVVTDPALGDDLDGDGIADDIRGHLLIVPHDACDASTWYAENANTGNTMSGSLHLSNIRVRKVDLTQRRVEILGWRSEQPVPLQ